MNDQNRQDVIALIQAKREELVASLNLLTGALIQHSHIVVSEDGLALKYEMDGQKVKSVAVAGGAHKASRFEKSDAEKLAACSINGHGKPAKAVHVTIAIREAIGHIDETLAILITP